MADFPIDEGKIINVNQYPRHSMSVCQRDSGLSTRVMERWLTSPLMKVYFQILYQINRAYPGSEFVVANTLAK